MEQAPTIQQTPGDAMSDSIERHPAYAQISASRVTGRTYLYGSDFAHQHFVTISIKASELHRGLSNDWPFARQEYIYVALSEAQWATFVSSLNAGSGVQCTLLHKEGERLPRLPKPAPRTDQFKQELSGHFETARATLGKLKERLESGKAGKEAISLVDKALMEIGGNAGFVAAQFGEHVEGTVERAKMEVNAYIQQTVTRLGLAAAKDAPLELTDGSE